MISVVVPVYNEERSIEPLLDELAQVLDGLERPWEVVVVDDGSTDGTFATLARLNAEQPQRARRPAAPQRRQGGRARRGLRRGGGGLVVTIDGDGQDDPHEIPRLLAKLDEGYDLVAGWKSTRRRTRSRGGSSHASSTPSPGACPACACTT